MKIYVIAGNYQQFENLTPEELRPHATYLADEERVAGLHGGVCLVMGTGASRDGSGRILAARRAGMRIFYE